MDNSNIKKINILILSVLFAYCGVVYGNVEDRYEDREDKEIVLPEKSVQRLTTVIDYVVKYYYKQVSVSALMDKAIRGMLSNLDPHSEYLDATGLKELEMEISGNFGGVGIQFVPDSGAIKVITPVDDSPASKAGIKAGDFIIQINNKAVSEMTFLEVRDMMRGPKGSKLTLTIVRKDKTKPILITLKRDIIKMRSIKDVKLLDAGYGYVRLAVFQEKTERDLILAIKKLQKLAKDQALNGLVIDLRNNPGGLVDSAVTIANDFLDANRLKNNRLIVYTKSQYEETQILAEASSGELLPNVPLVLLINEGSASAAEIVVGALQDHKRAIVVGTRSFGKGTVQTLLPIDSTTAIKLTTAIYYTPLGRCIQAKGIEPDIVVEDIKIPRNQSTLSLPRIDESVLMNYVQDDDELSNKIFEKKKKTKSELELAYKDYQLYEALHILKSLNVLKSQRN